LPSPPVAARTVRCPSTGQRFHSPWRLELSAGEEVREVVSALPVATLVAADPAVDFLEPRRLEECRIGSRWRVLPVNERSTSVAFVAEHPLGMFAARLTRALRVVDALHAATARSVIQRISTSCCRGHVYVPRHRPVAVMSPS
jgi:hypothetical protein